MQSESARLTGSALSPGIVIGTAYKVEPAAPAFYRIGIEKRDVHRELDRIRRAVETSKVQLRAIKRRFEKLVGKDHAYMIDVHLMILDDGRFLDDIASRIQDRLESPERAVRETAAKWLALYRSLEDPFFRERGSELRDVEERILANLQESNGGPVTLPESLVLVAPEVSLSLLAEYQLERVGGLVLTKAGRASHVAVIARSYRVPLVSGIERVESWIQTGDTVIVDGHEGVVWRNPAPGTLKRYRARLRAEQGSRDSLQRIDRSPCVTRDGRRISLYVNTEVENEAAAAMAEGAEGIGLFRSEFMFMSHKTRLMTEDEQFEVYRHLAESVGSKPAILRTLDVGEGRHPVFSVEVAPEGLSLGLRGIRLSLKHPDVFATQLRAILRASVHGHLKVVFPMVTSVDELLQGRRLLEQAQSELAARGVAFKETLEVGAMLEVPAAILTLGSLLDHADFVAVGTNDLIQYTLAAGRTQEEVDYLFNPLHPAVLSSLQRVAELGSRKNKQVYICGEVASDPWYAYVLVGLGFQHLSMASSSIVAVRNAVRGMDYQRAVADVSTLLDLPTLEEISEFARRTLPKPTER